MSGLRSYGRSGRWEIQLDDDGHWQVGGPLVHLAGTCGYSEAEVSVFLQTLAAFLNDPTHPAVRLGHDFFLTWDTEFNDRCFLTLGEDHSRLALTLSGQDLDDLKHCVQGLSDEG